MHDNFTIFLWLSSYGNYSVKISLIFGYLFYDFQCVCVPVYACVCLCVPVCVAILGAYLLDGYRYLDGHQPIDMPSAFSNFYSLQKVDAIKSTFGTIFPVILYILLFLFITNLFNRFLVLIKMESLQFGTRK